MDLFKEYNRLRKNLLQSARYHKITLTYIPTARQLATAPTELDIKTLKTQRESLKIITKKQNVGSPTVTAKIPKATGSKKSTSKPSKSYKTKVPKKEKSYANIYTKFGARYTAMSREGALVDKKTGYQILTPNEVMFGVGMDEKVGRYLHDTYGKDKYRQEGNPISELELFKQYVQRRIDASMEDYLSRDYKRRGSSLEGVETIQAMLDKMNDEDYKTALKRFQKYGDEIKNYLDEVLWYMKDDDEHYRALYVVTQMFDMDISNLGDEDIPSAEEIVLASEVEEMFEPID